MSCINGEIFVLSDNVSCMGKKQNDLTNKMAAIRQQVFLCLCNHGNCTVATTIGQCFPQSSVAMTTGWGAVVWCWMGASGARGLGKDQARGPSNPKYSSGALGSGAMIPGSLPVETLWLLFFQILFGDGLYCILFTRFLWNFFNIIRMEFLRSIFCSIIFLCGRIQGIQQYQRNWKHWKLLDK